MTEPTNTLTGEEIAGLRERFEQPPYYHFHRSTLISEDEARRLLATLDAQGLPRNPEIKGDTQYGEYVKGHRAREGDRRMMLYLFATQTGTLPAWLFCLDREDGSCCENCKRRAKRKNKP